MNQELGVALSHHMTASGLSVALLKPECARIDSLPAPMTEIFKQSTAAILGPHVRDCMELRLSRQQAADMWGASIGGYTWADAYYDHMTDGPVTALLLEGGNTAATLKHEVRGANRASISQLYTELNLGFSPDLVHGSDPGEAIREMEILRILTSETHRQFFT